MRIQHNIMALNAYRNYNTNTSALAKNLEKLSSGYRINRAGDDAAGLAISEKMRAQITGLNAAQKNVKDGVSLVKTAEGAMQEIQDMLNRMDYLATQSANGTYDSEVDRKNLQKEVEQLKSEINRIADSSNFNGTKLLDGSLGEKTTAADAAAIGLMDASAAITHIADAATAPDPQKGKFVLDLSQVSVTNNGTKAVITDATSAAAGTITEGTAGGKGSFVYDFAGAEIAQAAEPGGKVIVNIGGNDVEIDVDSTKKLEAKDIASLVAAKLNGTEFTIGGTVFNAATAAADGKLTLTTKDNGVTDLAGANIADFTMTPSTAIPETMKVEVTLGANGATGVLGTVDLGPDKTMSGAEWAEKFMTQTDGKVTIDGVEFNVTNDKGVLTFEMDKIPTEDFDTDLTTALQVKNAAGTVIAKAGGESSSVNPNIDHANWKGAVTIQGEGIGFHMTQEPVAPGAQAQAQGEFDLTAIGTPLRDGTALKIGSETYILAVGKDSEFKNFKGDAKIVDLTDQKPDVTQADLAVIAAKRLSGVSMGNTMFDVSTDNTTAKLRLTERKNSGIDYNKNNLEGQKAADLNDATAGGANPWQNLVQVGRGVAGAKAATTSGGLQLQIGDTSDSFNQLVVKVGDMHTKALGIADLDITNPESAASAIQTIRDAINYVSSTRGDLGATQNRLEHTANNLSVMAENIQDAESTIRDTDVAEEMMAYTKNNILIQSAQAMLAQANAVPQGVLQLLG